MRDWSAHHHNAHPKVSVAQHFDALCATQDGFFEGRFRIYLDTCYWVRLREWLAGQPASATIAAICEQLCALITNGRVVCPLSDVVFLEAMQARDPDRRAESTAVFDRISGGLCLRTYPERIRQEWRAMARHAMGRLASIGASPWVRPAFIWGVDLPGADDSPEARVVGKRTLDAFWCMTCAEVAQGEEDGAALSADMDRVAAFVNAQNEQSAVLFSSLQAMQHDEFRGLVQFFDAEVVSAILAEFGQPVASHTVEHLKAGMQALIYEACVEKPGYIATWLPTLYVQAVLHAARRWDKQSRLKRNDVMDIQHAAAGLGYHHAMFTERPLTAAIQRAKLHERYATTVLHAPEDVLAFLKGLAATRVSSVGASALGSLNGSS